MNSRWFVRRDVDGFSGEFSDNLTESTRRRCFAHVFLVIGPVYQRTGDADLAWRTGLPACFLRGVIETAGAFVADYLRHYTPRAVLLAERFN